MNAAEREAREIVSHYKGDDVQWSEGLEKEITAALAARAAARAAGAAALDLDALAAAALLPWEPAR